MSTVKNLNSILSEIFCNSQLTQRSFRPSVLGTASERSRSFWSAEESAILGSAARGEARSGRKKAKLVREGVNKKILLKKFRPAKFVSGIQSQFQESKKVG